MVIRKFNRVELSQSVYPWHVVLWIAGYRGCEIQECRCWDGASVIISYDKLQLLPCCLRTVLSGASELRSRLAPHRLSVYERLDWFFPSTLDADTARAIDYSSTRSGFLAQVAPRLRTSSHATTRCLIVPGRRPYAPLISKLIPWQAYEAALQSSTAASVAWLRLQLSAHHMRRSPETGDNLPYFRSVFEQITVAFCMVPVGALFLIFAVALTAFITKQPKSTWQYSVYNHQVNGVFSECDLPDFDTQIFATKIATRQQDSKTIHQIPTSVEESMDSGVPVCLNRGRRLLPSIFQIDEISSRSTKARIRIVKQARDPFETIILSSLHLAMNAWREGQPILAPPNTFSASTRVLSISSGTQLSKNWSDQQFI